MMREQMQARLSTLKGEYGRGQIELLQLESQVTSLRETLLRINGAVLVLEELLSPSESVTSAEKQPTANGADATVASGRSRNGSSSGMF
jgi:hypothetical protein